MAGANMDKREDYSDMEEEQGSLAQMLITLAGLIVASVVICTIVWNVSHKAPKNNIGPIQLVDVPSVEETLVENETSEEPVVQEEQDVPPVNGDATMEFDEMEDEITAKDVVTVRSLPSRDGVSNILGQITNGEKVRRIGINRKNGWSKIQFGGQVAYVATYLVTSDLEYKPELSQEELLNRVVTSDGRILIFTECDDVITAKEVVNMRTEPSTALGKDSVSAQLDSTGSARRTAISEDGGWSRVEYNGQTLYLVTSYTRMM